MKIFISLIFWFYASDVTKADIYHWVDDQGSPHYSDRPHRNAKVLSIDPGYSYFRVIKVYDGDTILLDNGLKVRFLGINTPEIETRNHPAEPGASEARNWLLKKLAQQKVRLETDVEKKDKYDRSLAHIFTESGDHLNLELVRAGLATVAIHPPNLKYTDSLLNMQSKAEAEKRGIWGLKYYAVRPFSELMNTSTKGWKRVTGEVKKIRKTRQNIYLLFSDQFSIKINKKNLDLFPDLNNYLGNTVEARGWMHQSKNRLVMRIRHPGSIKVIKQQNKKTGM